MWHILAITAPIYLLILLGVVAVRLGLVSPPDLRVLGQFVLRFALPALLFKTLSQRSLAEILNLNFLLAYGLGSLGTLGFGWWWARRRPESLRALIGMGMSFSNSGFIGAPVLLQWLGPSASVALATLLLADQALLRTAALGLAAMPMLSIYPVLAQKYQHQGLCAAALLLATVGSFFTLSALLGWIGPVPAPGP